jgi:hypothetical protein
VPGPTPDEYTSAHNAIMTLVGPEGCIATRFSSDALVDDFARALRQLIDMTPSALQSSSRADPITAALPLGGTGPTRADYGGSCPIVLKNPSVE